MADFVGSSLLSRAVETALLSVPRDAVRSAAGGRPAQPLTRVLPLCYTSPSVFSRCINRDGERDSVSRMAEFSSTARPVLLLPLSF